MDGGVTHTHRCQRFRPSVGPGRPACWGRFWRHLGLPWRAQRGGRVCVCRWAWWVSREGRMMRGRRKKGTGGCMWQRARCGWIRLREPEAVIFALSPASLSRDWPLSSSHKNPGYLQQYSGYENIIRRVIIVFYGWASSEARTTPSRHPLSRKCERNNQLVKIRQRALSRGSALARSTRPAEHSNILPGPP